MDVSRHRDLFNPEKFPHPIHVVGGGATGSWLTLCLAKLGLTNITTWDFDRVEEHNLPNQFFAMDDIGRNKVDALALGVRHYAGIEIITKNLRVDGNQPLEGIVFMLTDTMHSRKEIYMDAVKLKPSVKLLIETRMGVSEGRIYTINPMDFEQCKRYEATLYSDDEAPVSACGTSQSVVTTAMSIASQAVRQMINWHREVPINQELLIDFEYNNIYPQKF